MSANYHQVVQALQNLCQVPANNTFLPFEQILPRAFEYADNRIYRELGFLATSIPQNLSLTGGVGTVVLPSNIVSLQTLYVITPFGATSANSVRNLVRRVSEDMINFVYPNTNYTAGTASIPTLHSLVGATSGSPMDARGAITIRLGPAPDLAYTAIATGTVRPAALSKSNTTTFLSTYYPDLFIAACMIYLMGFQRDFSAQSSNAQGAMSWQDQYVQLRDGVTVESNQQKSASTAWTAMWPSPLANRALDKEGAG